MDFLSEAVRRLDEDDATFVAVRDGWTFVSHDRGIAPIMKLLSGEEDALRGACVADKVIGKAAALLLCHAGIERLYAKIISEHAIEALRNQSLSYEFGRSVPYIVNRAGNGMCPMERLVLDISRPDEAYMVLKEHTERK
jgi:iron complex outermembrane receptor protein